MVYKLLVQCVPFVTYLCRNHVDPRSQPKAKEQTMEDHQIQEHKEAKDTGKMGQQETKSKSNNDYKEWFLGDQRYMPTYIFLGDDNDPYQGNYKDHPSEEDQYKQLFL